MWCSHVVLTLKSGWNWYDVTIQTKYLWQYFLCFSKLNFEFLSYFEFGHILNWKCFFFLIFLGSGKGEALIIVIANHIPRDKEQDVDEEQQFWTSVLQKRVEEKTLAQSEWKVPKKRVKFPLTWLLHFTLWINQYYTLVSMFLLPFVYRLVFEIMMAVALFWNLVSRLAINITRWHVPLNTFSAQGYHWVMSRLRTYPTEDL